MRASVSDAIDLHALVVAQREANARLRAMLEEARRRVQELEEALEIALQSDEKEKRGRQNCREVVRGD